MTSGTNSRNQPGPVYDRAMRTVAQADIPGFCQVVGAPLESDDVGQVLSSTFPASTLQADLLVRIGRRRPATGSTTSSTPRASWRQSGSTLLRVT